MSKLRNVGWLLLVMGAFLSVPARAEIMDTTHSLGAGKVSLGAEFQAIASPSNFMVNFHEAIGLAGGLDFVLRQGLSLGPNNRPFYLGAGIKWTPLRGSKKRPGIALMAGGHYWIGNHGGADATFLIDYTISRFTPYAGLDFNLEFEDRLRAMLALLLGTRISINRYVAWFVEGGAEFIRGNHFISTGPRVYF